MDDRRNWVAIEIDFADNPKILSVGALGGWAHLRAIVYCARHRTDGFLPTAAVWAILHDDPDMDEASAQANGGLAASMVEAGLWHPVSNGYMVHDYLKHQTNAETMREKRARAGRLGGLKSASKRASKSSKSKLEVEKEKEVEEEKDKTPLPQPSPRPPASRAPKPDAVHALVAQVTNSLDDIPF